MAILSPEDIVSHDGDVEAAIMAKRATARDAYKETGSFPQDWEKYCKIFESPIGRPPKYNSADEYYSKGVAYFQEMVRTETTFTLTKLALWMGFPSPTAMRTHALAHHEFREPRAFFYSVIRAEAEERVMEAGGQPGKMFVMKNIPDCILASDDLSTREVSIWADKQITELTGANGGPLEIKRDISPEEAYMQMLDGGTLEAVKEEVATALTEQIEDEIKIREADAE